ncbi:MAG: sigma-54-dependent transcriptional regulator [Bdellovibrionales bacterium]
MLDNRLRLLVVDDDNLVLQTLRMAIPDQWHLTGVNHPDELPEEFFDAAFVDMHLLGSMESAEGLNVLETLQKQQPHMELVAISGDLDRSLMEKCLKHGATRFLAKPLNKAEVNMILEKIEALILLRNASFRAGSNTIPWIGTGDESLKIKRIVADLTGEPGPILIEGESGTGKEVVAKLLHSQNTNRPFIAVNAAAIPEAVFESEFFGHVKGAFTGADQNKIGLAEAAHEGDLFIDEIEALPKSQQAKLLRFLESGEIRRVGAKDTIKVKVRLIAATNRNLEEMIKREEFREDLLWRISGKKIDLPPLRSRKEDLPALADHFLEMEKPYRNKTLDLDAMQELTAYPWPGNVRELKRMIERLCLTSPLPIIRAEDVKNVLGIKKGSASAMNPDLNTGYDLEEGLQVLVASEEKKIIQFALSQITDIDDTAKKLKISRSSLYKKIKDHNIGVK